MRGLHGIVPVLGGILVLLGLMVISAQAVFSASSSFSEYGGDIVESEEEVAFAESTISKAGSAITASGLTPATAVIMTTASPPPLASMSIAKKNWYYDLQVSSITGTTPANATFKVELHRWNSTTSDYTLVATLYVKSDADPASTEKARVYFDLGSTAPSSSEAFMVLATQL